MSENDGYLKEGWIVYIDDPLLSYYKIVRREPFDYETGEEDAALFSTVAFGAESGFVSIEVLEPDKDPQHLFQVRWGVQHTLAKYYIKIPSGQNRFGIDDDKEIGFVNADKSPFYDPNPQFEFWLINGWVPAVNCRNNGPTTIRPKIWFKGYKYDIEKVADQRGASVGAYRKIVFGGLKNTP
jgi:hypothetical protein